MTQKASIVFEKLALDFGTTRGLLRAFKAGGGKLIRLSRGVAEYKQKGGQDVIYIPKGEKNPRFAFFHEFGHFLDLRKANKRSVAHRDLLKTEQKANIIARRSITNPEHRKFFEAMSNKNFETYKTYARAHETLRGLSNESMLRKYPILAKDAFGKLKKIK